METKGRRVGGLNLLIWFYAIRQQDAQGMQFVVKEIERFWGIIILFETEGVSKRHSIHISRLKIDIRKL